MERISKKKMNKMHNIENITFQGNTMDMVIDSKAFSIKLSDVSPIIEKASLDEKNNFVISPSGYGISWPTLDEDLSIDGLLKINHKPVFKKRHKQTDKPL